MNYVKAFIAGLALPGTISPLVFGTLVFLGQITFLEIAPLYLVGIVWGIWNMFYFLGIKRLVDHVSNRRMLLGLHGAMLGLIIFFTMFLLKVFQTTGWPALLYYPLIVIIPGLYYLFWYYIVSWLNRLMGLEV